MFGATRIVHNILLWEPLVKCYFFRPQRKRIFKAQVYPRYFVKWNVNGTGSESCTVTGQGQAFGSSQSTVRDIVSSSVK